MKNRDLEVLQSEIAQAQKSRDSKMPGSPERYNAMMKLRDLKLKLEEVQYPNLITKPTASSSSKTSRPKKAKTQNILYEWKNPDGSFGTFTAPARFNLRNIHPSVHIGQGITIGEGVTIGECSIIGDRTELVRGAQIGNYVYIGTDCIIGKRKAEFTRATGVVIWDGAWLGNFVRLSSKVRVGPCVVLEDDVVLQAGVKVGAHSFIDQGVLILHTTSLGDSCNIGRRVYISARSSLGRECVVSELSSIGDGALISDEVNIAARSFVAMGARIPQGAKLEEESIVCAKKNQIWTTFGLNRDVYSLIGLPIEIATSNDHAIAIHSVSVKIARAKAKKATKENRTRQLPSEEQTEK